MPLTMASIGEIQTIKKVGGKQDVKLFLESLGFTVGAIVTVVSKNQGNLITKIKESRVAISKEMANKIII
ncbi:MAG: FeoA family protein [Thomasclavelia sp.]|uniref:FeoA family protein n=1 Tax=Thomasclavelia sp. TaxID=3025757 RepID=UPI0039A00F40